MKKNQIIIIVIIAIVAAAAGFFAGKSVGSSARTDFTAGQFRNRTGGSLQSGFRPVNGEIIAADDESITVKLADGSSKIIILSDKTAINKASEGAKTDLKVGERVTAFGSNNTDGSVTAENISIGTGMFREMRGRMTPTP